ncbi:kinetochore protein Spc25-like [Sycon ciliatum]|uniref:kinetochore protein Spc25-like n=1 Tax=Sycon ciliatum TaxID=27933 RepID=UPI0020AA9780
MERLEKILNDRLQLGEAFVDRVHQSRAELERQLLERDTDYQRQINESNCRLKAALAQLQHSADDLQVALLEQEVQQLESEASAINCKYETVDSQCQLFEDLLKIKLLRIEENTVQFVMSHIDPADPEQVFLFTLRPEDNGSFTVFDQDPDLPNFHQLVTELNQTKDTGKFVRAIRKGWEEQMQA